MKSDDYDDPKVEAKWLAKQRDNVRQYMQNEGIQQPEVASESDCFVVPYLSVWRVGPMKDGGVVRWWVISGDLPTDYLSDDDASDARAALAAFAARWLEVSAYMLRGQEHPTIKIGFPGNRQELGELLSARAEIIKELADEDSNW